MSKTRSSNADANSGAFDAGRALLGAVAAEGSRASRETKEHQGGVGGSLGNRARLDRSADGCLKSGVEQGHGTSTSVSGLSRGGRAGGKADPTIAVLARSWSGFDPDPGVF